VLQQSAAPVEAACLDGLDPPNRDEFDSVIGLAPLRNGTHVRLPRFAASEARRRGHDTWHAPGSSRVSYAGPYYRRSTPRLAAGQ